MPQISHGTNLVVWGISLLISTAAAWAGDTSLTECLQANNVPLLTKNSTEWFLQKTPWNVRLQYTPAEIVLPESINHVQRAVICAVDHNVRVSAKSGGHSFGSFGYGGQDGHLVVALDHMASITLRGDGLATIQPGAKLGDVALKLYNQGRRAIPHGECPSVGIGGHALHGGIGLISRKYGMTLDWLRGATVVLANGTALNCSETENEDLFWAIRGAGSSFGIVTHLQFKTFAAPDVVTYFDIKQNWSRSDAVTAIQSIQNFALSAPSEISLDVFVRPGGQEIRGMYYGDYDGLGETVRPLLGQLQAKITFAKSMGWIEGLMHLAGGQRLDTTPAYIKHNNFYATNAMTSALSLVQIRSLVSTIYDNLENKSDLHHWSYIMELHGGPNSAISNIGRSSTAFPHRDKPFLHQMSTIAVVGQPFEPGFSVLERFREAITTGIEEGKWGMYANYIDTEIKGTAAPRLYWGSNLKRLQRLKAILDPDGLFWNPQGVRPSLI